MEDAFQSIAAQITGEDSFVFFIAGHGESLDGKYYYLPHSFSVLSTISDGISQDQLEEWITSFKSANKLVLLDTCYSGTFIENFWKSKLEYLLKNSKENKMMMVKKYESIFHKMYNATNAHFITAAAADEVARESFDYGHGYFTYGLLQAFCPMQDNVIARITRSDSNSNSMIDDQELYLFADNYLREILNAPQHIQHNGKGRFEVGCLNIE
ncbi:MAG: hypothetical protein CSB33_01690 [Desulfobacterales bacterium]|nr:MAG: hypothetical protein CSB33_01690 [Desulfobacterales bacterium]